MKKLYLIALLLAGIGLSVFWEYQKYVRGHGLMYYVMNREMTWLSWAMVVMVVLVMIGYWFADTEPKDRDK